MHTAPKDSNSISSGTSWELQTWCPRYLSVIIDISISHTCWDIWKTALQQHCNSISSGTLWKFKHDALFVYNMNINHWYLLTLILLEIIDKQHCTSTATASAHTQVWYSNMMPCQSIICIVIIDIYIFLICLDIRQTALHQHCNSIISGRSKKLKHDALFVYNMYVSLWYLYPSFFLIIIKQHCTSTATASAKTQFWSSNMMPHFSIICILITGISISHICWYFWQTALHQHCNSISLGKAGSSNMMPYLCTGSLGRCLPYTKVIPDGVLS